jgi:hypothetical protein
LRSPLSVIHCVILVFIRYWRFTIRRHNLLKGSTHHAASRHRWRGLGVTRRGKLRSFTVVYLNLINKRILARYLRQARCRLFRSLTKM